MSSFFSQATDWTMALLPAYCVALVVGYLLGSVPFGLLLTRSAGTADLRSIGSGNIGATNVLRTGRKDLAALTLLLDALKGTFAVALAGYLLGLPAAILAGFGAFIGHLWPVWPEISWWQGRCDLSRHCTRLLVGRSACLHRHLARSGETQPVFLALGPDRQRRAARDLPRNAWVCNGCAVFHLRAAALVAARAQHSAPARRHRRPDRAGFVMEDLFGSGHQPNHAKRTGIALSDRQRLDWLRLYRSENVGPRTFQSLLNRFGGAAAALEALPDMLKQKGGRTIALCSVADAEREIETCLRNKSRFIARGEPDYPAALAAIDAGPPLIAVKGRVEVLQLPSVAIVGSRNASAVGLKMTERLAVGLNDAGFAVVSGLARGIDTRAHQTSLDFGTIAVLAGGLDRPYPPENIALLDALCERGAVIAEMPLRLGAARQGFPAP